MRTLEKDNLILTQKSSVYYCLVRTKSTCQNIKFFSVGKILCKNMQYFLCNGKKYTVYSLKKEALGVVFLRIFWNKERSCYTSAVTLIHTQDTTREQLQRQQLMKWSDGVLSEKWLAKKNRLVWGYLDSCSGGEYFKREEWHSVLTQNRKDHKQILTSHGKHPGSDITQEAVTVKVETGSVSVTA